MKEAFQMIAKFRNMYLGLFAGIFFFISLTLLLSSGADATLVAEWHFDEGAGQIVSDASGYDNDGRLGQTISSESSDPFWTSQGISGSALEFDGVDDYVQTPHSSELAFGADDFSVFAWIKTTSGDNGFIIEKSWTEWNGGGFELLYSASGKVSFGTVTLSSYRLSTSIHSVNDGNWHFIVGCRKSDRVEIYVDGVLDGFTIGTAHNIENSDTLNIGTRTTAAPANYFDGAIDQVRIYNRALTPSEISGNYNETWQNYLENETLVAEWPFDEGTGQWANDTSGNDNGGTLGPTTGVESNDPTWTTGIDGNALEFDGIDDYLLVPDSSTIEPANQITIEAWVKIRNVDTVYERILSKYVDVASSYGSYQIITDVPGSDAGKIWFTIQTTSGYTGIHLDKPIEMNEWYHITSVYNGTHIMIYLNGILDNITTWSGDIVYDNGPLYIGRDAFWSAAYFNGSLDDIKIWSRALSQEEILQGYTDKLAFYDVFDRYTGWTPAPNNRPGASFKVTDGNMIVENWGTAVENYNTISFDKVLNDPIAPGDDFSLTSHIAVVGDPTSSHASVMVELVDDSDNIIGWMEWDDSQASSGYGDFLAKAGDVYVYPYQNGGFSTAYPTINGVLELKRESGAWSFYYEGMHHGTTEYVPTNKTITKIRVVMFHHSSYSGRDIRIDWIKVTKTLDTSLIAEWSFNEGSGQVANDISLNGNDGTLGPTNGAESSDPTWTSAGISGNALEFDGVDDYVNCGSDPKLHIQGDVTISWWMKMDTIVEGAGLVYYGATGETEDENLQYELILKNTGDIILKHEYGSGNDQYNQFDVNLKVNTWYHVAGVRDTSENQWHLYINGEEPIAPYTFTQLPTDGAIAELIIGNNRASIPNFPFDGIIDEVSIWSRALTSSKIFNDYNETWQNYLENELKVAEWHFDEGTGTTAYDSSGNGNDGTINGAIWSEGISGNALSFDGTNGYVNIPRSSDFEPNHITIECWISPSAISLGQVINHRDGYDQWRGYSIEFGGGFLGGTISTGTTLNDKASAGIPTSEISLGTWHHIGLTWDGSTLKIYLNGELKDSDSTSTSGNIAYADVPLRFGTRADYATQEFYHGIINEVHIWNRALSAEEISADYNAIWQHYLENESKVAEWHFNEGSGTATYDSSGSNDGTIYGATWVGGISGKALNFDGVDDYVEVGDIEETEGIGTITVKAWFKTRSITSPGSDFDQMIVNKNGPYQLGINGNIIRGGVYNGAWEFVDGTTNLAIDAWYHVTLVFDTPNLHIYLDGMLENSTTTAIGNIGNTVASLQIGRDHNFGGRWFFNGTIDEVSIWHRALTPTEIQQHYEQYPPVPEVPRDTIPPIIDSPPNIQYVLGQTNNSITWHPLDGNASAYNITQDGTILDSGLWYGGDIPLVVDSLQAGIYNFTCWVNDTSGNWNWDTVVVNVYAPPSPPVFNPLTSPDSDGAYTVSWSLASGADSYVLEEDDNPGFSSPTNLPRSNTFIVLTGKNNGVYYYRVKAINAIIESNWSENASIEVAIEDLPGPSPPSAIYLNEIPVGDITGNSVRISWSQNPDADFNKYEIHKSTNQDFSLGLSSLYTIVTDQPTTSAIITGLSPTNIYFFKVRVYDTENLFTDSDEVSATTKEDSGVQLPLAVEFTMEEVNVTGKCVIRGISTGEDILWIEVKIDSGEWKTVSGTTYWSYEWDTSRSEDGTHTIYARAYAPSGYSDEIGTAVKVSNVEDTGGDILKPIFDIIRDFLREIVITLIATIIATLFVTFIVLPQMAKGKEKEDSEDSEE